MPRTVTWIWHWTLLAQPLFLQGSQWSTDCVLGDTAVWCPTMSQWGAGRGCPAQCTQCRPCSIFPGKAKLFMEMQTWCPTACPVQGGVGSDPQDRVGGRTVWARSVILTSFPPLQSCIYLHGSLWARKSGGCPWGSPHLGLPGVLRLQGGTPRGGQDLRREATADQREGCSWQVTLQRQADDRRAGKGTGHSGGQLSLWYQGVLPAHCFALQRGSSWCFPGRLEVGFPDLGQWGSPSIT